MIPHPNLTRGSPRPLFGDPFRHWKRISGRRPSKFTCMNFDNFLLTTGG